MSVFAFVLLNVTVGTDRECVNKLRGINGVKEVYEVYAVYDIIAMVETETLEELNRLVNSEIRKISDITSTHTIIAEKFA